MKIKHLNTFDEFDNEVNKFFDDLKEALGTPVEIEYLRQDDTIYGFFVVNDSEYLIEAKFILHDFLTFKFKAKTPDNKYTMEITNDRNCEKHRVLPTVEKGLLHIINTYNPRGVIFATLDSSIGRKRLYDKFTDKYISNNKNKKCTKHEYNNEKIYIIHDITENADIVIDVVKYTYENLNNIT
jgi:hypothetical protein